MNKISAADSFLPAAFYFFPSVLESEFPLPDNIRCQNRKQNLPLTFIVCFWYWYGYNLARVIWWHRLCLVCESDHIVIVYASATCDHLPLVEIRVTILECIGWTQGVGASRVRRMHLELSLCFSWIDIWVNFITNWDILLAVKRSLRKVPITWPIEHRALGRITLNCIAFLFSQFSLFDILLVPILCSHA